MSRKILSGPQITLITFVGLLGFTVATFARERVSFNDGWLFQKDDPAGIGDKLAYANIKDWVTATGGEFTKDETLAAKRRPPGNLGEDVPYVQPGFDDNIWRRLNLPHDWGIEGPFKQEYPGETGKLPWWGVAWYRKHFSLPATDAGQRFILELDGAMSYAMVWLNGQFVGGWPYGYASWQLDLTPYVKIGGENVLAIRLDNPKDSSRWYPGGGIYRNVWLTKTGPIHVGQWGVFISTPQVNKATTSIQVEANVDNNSTAAAHVNATTALFALKPDGTRFGEAVAVLSASGIEIASGKSVVSTATFTIGKPKLWSIEHPNRYVAVTRLEVEGKTVDQVETPFGIRSIEFNADRGFLLNGERLRIQGVCDHHDLGALGSALNTRALERQLEILKDMGCNAIRTSHNPPAPELLDLCDRLGLVVMDEAFDCWKRGKKKNDYHLLFADWHEKDWRAQIRRDRNHPCVILWSTGNEIPEQGSPAGHQISAELTRIAHEEDPTRPATAGCNNTQAGFNGFQKTVDVFGYNYKPQEYGKVHAANPGLPIFGSETASCVSSRGEYFFPVSDNKAKGLADFQVSSYDLSAPPWAMPPDPEFRGQDQNPFVAGEFVWTGFDYLGEPTPYNSDLSNLNNFSNPEERARAEKELNELGKIRTPSRSSYFGIVDLAGFRKDRFYLYQARWRPDLPMAHILPHWNWPEREGQITPVHVYTSGDEAELFLNGRSLGRKRKEPFQYRLRWDEVKYEPGELRVVAYRAGKKWATDAVKTSGPAAKLTLAADRSTIAADGKDLSFITVTVADKKGELVPRSHNHIQFEIEGPGKIVAADNGDATSFESFQSPERKAFNGLALVIVRAKVGEAGKIKLIAKADELATGSVTIRAK
jgi:beta-galactosidase